MTLEISKLHYPVTVLGPGVRAGVWTQGCAIRCEGCISVDTWARRPDAAVPVGDIVAWIRGVAPRGLDGVTISGGEPLDQPEGFLRLLDALGRWREDAGLDFDVLCYSGRSWEEVQRDFPEHLGLMDAIVVEPFLKDQPTDGALRGSANQRVVPTSARGAERYRDVDADARLLDQRTQMQVDATGGKIWMIGIPKEGAMATIESRAQDAGLALKGASWLH